MYAKVDTLTSLSCWLPKIEHWLWCHNTSPNFKWSKIRQTCEEIYDENTRKIRYKNILPLNTACWRIFSASPLAVVWPTRRNGWHDCLLCSWSTVYNLATGVTTSAQPNIYSVCTEFNTLRSVCKLFCKLSTSTRTCNQQQQQK